jgi:hypothetical protein
MRALSVTALVAVALTTTGCFQLDVATTILADGSGTATAEIAMPCDVARVLYAGLPPGSEVDVPADAPTLGQKERERAERLASLHGVELLAFEHDASDDRQTARLTVAFADLASYSRFMGDMLDEDANDEILQTTPGEGGICVLEAVPDDASGGEPGRRPPRDGQDTEPTPESSDDQSVEDLQTSLEVGIFLMSHVRELDVEISFTLPGDIVMARDMLVEGRTAVWRFAPRTPLAAGFQEFEPHIVFACEEPHQGASPPED